MRQIPAIICDIDGVLIRGSSAIKGSETVLQRILNYQFNFSDSISKPFNIPFVCLTNGGGYVEDQKAKQLNSIFKDNMIHITKEQIILNFTPLREVFQKSYLEVPILCCGSGQIINVAYDCGLKYFVYIDEYAALFQEKYSVFREKRPSRQSIIEVLKKRFQASEQDVEKILKNIEAIFILHDPVFWEDSMQVKYQMILEAITDLCEQKNVPIFVVNDDTVYADTFKLPRLAFGSFNSVLKEMNKKLFNKELDFRYYGKPSLNTSNYAAQYLNKKFNDVGNIYMIGDNPKSDIRGATRAGWTSILVRSGVFQGGMNDIEDPADFVVADFKEAFELILSRESLSQI